MIGNDIIDLDLANRESNWQRKGYLNKIMTTGEQELIHNAQNPHEMVWYLWSLKEAAYKIYNRQTQHRGFIPLRLECKEFEWNGTEHYAKVYCGIHEFWTQTRITKSCIDTIAVGEKDNLKKVVSLHSKAGIEKKNGIPFRIVDAVLKPVSISHHGRYERIVSLIE
jgi:phosphopantetheinyl transferase (holo-ACP synthase)